MGVAATVRFAATVAVKVTRPLASWGLISWPSAVVVGVASRNCLWEKVCSNIQEVKSRGATVVLVGNDGDHRTADLADHVLWVPSVEPMLSPVVDALPLQFLAYWLAQAHGLDVDRPRNLAKTVTVE